MSVSPRRTSSHPYPGRLGLLLLGLTAILLVIIGFVGVLNGPSLVVPSSRGLSVPLVIAAVAGLQVLRVLKGRQIRLTHGAFLRKCPVGKVLRNGFLGAVRRRGQRGVLCQMRVVSS